MSTLAIGQDTVVTLAYLLLDERGDTVEQATVAEPLVYIHGYEEIVPGLEKALAGMVAGDKREVSVSPEDAFGPHDAEGVFEVGRTDFPDPEKVQVGDEFIAQSPDGDEVAMRVVEILPESFRMDTNHPLAGQTVRFQVEVQSVRAASEEEISEAQDRLEQHEHHEHHGDAACGCGHEHN